MANIVVIHYGGAKVDGKYKTFIFYEGLIEALRKNGNDVMEIITNDFLVQPWGGTNKLKYEINKSKLISSIVGFKPDLIFSFNNSLVDGLEKAVSCPIAIWSADHFYHFNDLEKLKANKDRFIYFCMQSGDMEDCQRIIGVGPEKCFRVKPATSVKADLNRKKTNNIIFVGSPFGNGGEKEKLHKYKKEFIELGKKLIKKEGDAKELARVYEKIQDVHETILDFGSVANRTNVLSHVAPLGLTLHGGEGWLDVGLDSSLDIFDAYVPTQVYSVSQTQNAYNSSKIGININHSQAKTGFSWRVMDILASSAVLVSNYSPDLVEELGEELSREVIYHSPSEAYEICLKFLNNEDLRKKIVRQSNEIVEKFHTWDIRIKEIEKILQLGLVGIDKKKGTYTLLEAKKYAKIFSLGVSSANTDSLTLRKILFFILPHGIVMNLHIVKGLLTEMLCFIFPYGIVKNIRNGSVLSDGKMYKSSKLNVSNFNDIKNLIMRVVRFISPYGVVKIIRVIKKNETSLFK